MTARSTKTQAAAQGHGSLWLPKQPRLGEVQKPVSSTEAGDCFGEKGSQGTGWGLGCCCIDASHPLPRWGHSWAVFAAQTAEQLRGWACDPSQELLTEPGVWAQQNRGRSSVGWQRTLWAGQGWDEGNHETPSNGFTNVLPCPMSALCVTKMIGEG